MTIKIDETILKIIGELEKEDSHNRELARKTKINRTTINQKLKHLREEKIILGKISGKNKTYKLNNNTKTKQLIKIEKETKLLRIYQKETKLERIIKKLQEINATIILFGSYAKETNNKNSDVDLIIITKNYEKAKKTMKEIKKTTNLKINDQYTEKLDENPLNQEIKKSGVVIKYEQEIY